MCGKKFNLNRMFSFVIFLCLVLFLESGCVPLKKKFTRQKKKDKDAAQNFIPVLDPVDYPKKTYLPEESYGQHYSLWKVWIRDLLQAVQAESSDKNQKFLLNQAIEQLENMNTQLEGNRQEGLAILIGDARNILKEYDRPASMRSKFTMRRKIELNEKKIRTEFSPKVLFP